MNSHFHTTASEGKGDWRKMKIPFSRSVLSSLSRVCVAGKRREREWGTNQVGIDAVARRRKKRRWGEKNNA